MLSYGSCAGERCFVFRLFSLSLNFRFYSDTAVYGAGAVDVVRFFAGHLLLAHSRAACIGPLSRVELAIARRVSCSDFRLTSHVSHNRTERALQLASQHVVAGAAVLVLPELSLDPVAQVSIGHP